MCPSNAPAAATSHAPADFAKSLDWRLEQIANLWQLVIRAKVRPEIELNSSEVSVQLFGEDAHILRIPVEAQPVGIDEASCKYSKKKGELVITWPRLPSEVNSVAQSTSDFAAGDKTDSNVSPTQTEPVASDPSLEVKKQAMDAPKEEQPKEPLQQEDSAAEVEAVEPPPSAVHTAEEWKALGNEAVASSELDLALQRYTYGLEQEPSHAMLLSNRALCFHRLGRLEEALADSRLCASLRPDFMKGFLRAGLVLRELKRPAEAMEMLRRSPKHDEIEKLCAQLRPEVEEAESKRIAGLTGAERKKEEGNALFKKGLFEQALVLYDEAMAFCAADNDKPELEVAVRNNRAACQHQLSNFSAVLEDTSKVLEKEPDNLKALVRRMLALEPLEKYEAALEDARKVLRFCPGHEMANRLQHRLGKLVRDSQRQQAAAAA